MTAWLPNRLDWSLQPRREPGCYIDRVSQIPVLTKDDEVRSRNPVSQRGRLGRRTSVGAVAPAVRRAHRRGYLGYGLPMGDLVQEGNVGLMKASSVSIRTSACGCVVRRPLDPRGDSRVCSAQLAAGEGRHTKSQRKLFFNLRKMKKNLAWLSDEETRRWLAISGRGERCPGDGAAPFRARHVLRSDAGERRGYDLFTGHVSAASNADPAIEVEREDGRGFQRPAQHRDGEARRTQPPYFAAALDDRRQGDASLSFPPPLLRVGGRLINS